MTNVKTKKNNEETRITSFNLPSNSIEDIKNDIKLLEKGKKLEKMNQDKKTFTKRLYRLDLKNSRLVANTRQCGKKEKTYPFDSINEITAGCGSVGLKTLKTIKSKKAEKTDELDDLTFVVTYDNFKKSLDLKAPNKNEQKLWIRVLSHLIAKTKKENQAENLDWTKDEAVLDRHFLKADKSNDSKINIQEVNAFLESINLKLKKDQIQNLIKQADKNNDGHLTKEEFKQFVVLLFQRKEMMSLFYLVAAEKNSESFPEFMSVEKFKRFLERYQKENKSIEECIELIKTFELDSDHKQKNQFSFQGFVNFMNDESQFIANPEHNNVYQNMNLPIFNYFVNSSHNTYLTGDQLTSDSSADCYRAAIMAGARLVEMDVYDGSDNRPRIFHQKTLTSKMLFEDALIIIKDYGFKLSEYPIIITIELHCSPDQQKVMAELIKQHLGEFLYTEKFDGTKDYPTLNQLKRKVLIRSQMPKMKMKELPNMGVRELRSKTTLKRVDSFEEIDESPVEQIKEYGDLINLMQNVSFKGVDYAFENYKKSQTSSLSEGKCDDFIKNETSENIIKYTSNYLVKVYPGFFRTNSNNLNAVNYWNYGFQIAALNFQTNDNPMILNKALFNDNGNCGYVLKPKILLNPALKFDPLNNQTMTSKKLLEIKVISALQLPYNKEIIKDISDPFVVVNLYGVDDDLVEVKTKSINDNGFNPIWNQDFKFVVNCPDLALLKFTVMDEDVGKDDLIGDYAIRFNNMRPGYRHIKLKNKYSQGVLFIGIRITSIPEPIKQEFKAKLIEDVIEHAPKQDN